MRLHRTHSYTIVVPLATFEKRFELPEHLWPDHITLLGGVHHEGRVVDMMRAIVDVTSRFSPFDVTFGPQHTEYGERPAQNIVEGAETLRTMHSLLIQSLGRAGCTFFRTEFTAIERGYNPHVSRVEPMVVPTDVHSVLVIAKYLKGCRSVDSPSVKQLEGKVRLIGASEVW